MSPFRAQAQSAPPFVARSFHERLGCRRLELIASECLATYIKDSRTEASEILQLLLTSEASILAD